MVSKPGTGLGKHQDLSSDSHKSHKEAKHGAGELVQQFQTHSALAEDLNPVPSTHTGDSVPIALAPGDPTLSPGF